jgi:hypothetical protein
MGTLGVLGAATTATTAATLSAMSTITPVITGGLVGGSAPAQPAVPTGPAPVVMVFFIGGCTYTEIAALRWLSKQPGTLALFGRPAVTIAAIDVADEARVVGRVVGCVVSWSCRECAVRDRHDEADQWRHPSRRLC